MKIKYYLQLFLSFFMIFFFAVVKIHAEIQEDVDTPISFKPEMLSWEYVDNIIPNKSIFTIIDVEKGLSFKVQRRAGSHHADVQLLTSKDTEIMKKIYDDEWSWNRRAIIVLTDDQMYAASMTGMPHGRGVLKNNFPGHFCVHFYKSTTHRSQREDLAHQLMVMRAAGKLEDYLASIDPLTLLDVLKVAINQKDRELLNMILTESDMKNELLELLHKFYFFQVDTDIQRKNLQEEWICEIPTTISYILKKGGKVKQNIHFVTLRQSISGRWLIDTDSLINELQ